MKRNVTGKNLRRTIQRSIGRYLAIALIIALGASMFVGLLSTKADMVATGQKYLDEQNMFDLRLLNTYGWTQAEVDAVKAMAGVTGAEGHINMDALVYYGDAEEGSVYQLHSIPQDINKVYLLGGRMPASPDECLLDGYHVGDEVLGTKITIAQENGEDKLENLAYHSYTVVGYVSTPLYMDMSRGSTSLGNGDVQGYLYFMPQAFAMDVFTEISVTIQGSYDIYSDAFSEALKDMAQQLRPHVKVLADARFASLKADAEAEYAEGLREYEDGLAEFTSGKEAALAALDDALKELEAGQKQLDDNWQTVRDGYSQLEQAQAELNEQASLLQISKQELLAAKTAAYQQMLQGLAELKENETKVREGLAQVNAGIAQIDDGIAQMDAGILALEDGLKQIADGLSTLELILPLLQAQVDVLQRTLDALLASPVQDAWLIESVQAQLAEAQAELDTYLASQAEALAMQQTYTAQLEDIRQQRSVLANQREELVQTQSELEGALVQIEDGKAQLEMGYLEAELQFADAQAQLDAGQMQLDVAQKQLDASRSELDAAAETLTQGQAELEAGWQEYTQGKLEAEAEFAEAEGKLQEAAAKLADAREAIDSLAPAELFILDRNTNTGYIALDNNSDIVAGVSRVFPAFFLLVAALVCITTMTRMVEEERTQIGTMKALGYSNWQIIRKYVYYAGSAAIVGCGIGTVLGSVVFPTILWEAYKIILNITPNIVLRVDWLLCGIVVFVYTAVMLLVTWYCCRRTLKEVPAELIRPKAPTAGKKTWLEYLPFWKRLSFLNKVMLRNVVRYRQRMLMMLVGVGGCTALLLTGFGLRDSLVNIVTDQFEKVTVYDLSVYFNGPQTQLQQEEFLASIDRETEDALFYYQASVEIVHGDDVREVYMLVSDQRVKNFIHFGEDGKDLGMPDLNEVFISAGIAENAGISVGDRITLRDSDMRTLYVTVAGIFDNMVNNYAFVTQETYEAQLGFSPGFQMAFVNVPEYMDVYEAAATIGEQEGVMNVMICQETASQVTSMLEALDMVVVTIVICAAALAVIVLYNLTNINITERIREIATIKVLGFHALESAMYVFKENLLLSVLGVGAGMLMGKYLLAFVVSQIKVDFVFFQPQIGWFSCVLAMLLTMLSALIVDFLLYFKLDKINMAEALKSVE